jgi:beta-lactamase regulating signal transducer with metallopeptidase domain
MDPSLGLHAASGLVNFLLRTTLEWLVCLLLVRVAGSAKSRFNVWLMLLFAFVAQWIWMLAGVARGAFPAQALAAGAMEGMPAAAGKRIAIAAPAAGTVTQGMAALLVVYGAMLAWRMLGALAARVRLARAMRYRSAPSKRVATAFQEAVEQAGLGGELDCSPWECELWVLPGLSSPATLGWRRPQVIVPPACEQQDEAELKAVFWHELKHVERRDALWNALVRACCNLLWFHPAVHHAVASLNAQRELACDAAVVREHPQSRDIYAACLVRFARMRDLVPEPAIPAIEMASSAALLTLRVRSILSDGAESAGASRIARAGRATANLLLAGAMAATVPGLNILFAAEQRNSVAPLSIAGKPRIAPMKRTLAAGGKPANARTGSTASLPSAAGAEAAGPISAAALQQDEGLAAEHRAALSVLTESTGMDAQEAASDGRASPGLNGGAIDRGTAGKTSNANSTSWGTVAADAAAHMGPLMGDHDGDDRH